MIFIGVSLWLECAQLIKDLSYGAELSAHEDDEDSLVRFELTSHNADDYGHCVQSKTFL